MTAAGDLTDDGRPHVTFCADGRFLLPLAMAATSVSRTLGRGRSARVTVVHQGFAPAALDRLARHLARRCGNLAVSWAEVGPDQTAGLRAVGHLSAGVYLRLGMGELLPRLSRTIYLDCDLIVRRDVTDLWAVDAGGRTVLAAVDETVRTVGSPHGIPTAYRAVGLAADDPCLNSGVMVVDLARWRAAAVGRRAVDHCTAHAAELNCGDQDGLNVALAGDWGQLDGRWNAQHGAMTSEWGPGPLTARQQWAKLRRSYIYHYTGPAKPWGEGLVDFGRGAFLWHLSTSRWLTVAELGRLAVSEAKRAAGRVARHAGLRH